MLLTIMSKNLRYRKKDVKNDKKWKWSRCSVWLIDLTGLRPIIFDVLGVFLHVQIHLEVSTKKFGSAGILGLPYDVIKTLKLQYFLNGMCYEGGW